MQYHKFNIVCISSQDPQTVMLFRKIGNVFQYEYRLYADVFFPSKIVWGKVSAFFFFTPSSPMGKPRIIVFCYHCCGTVNNSIKIFHGTSFCFQNVTKHTKYASKVNSTKVVLLTNVFSLYQPLTKNQILNTKCQLTFFDIVTVQR